MKISNSKSAIPRNHNETKKFKSEKWLLVCETESQKNISQIIMHNQ